MEIYAGFVFARVQGGGPSVAAMLAPYAQEIAAHDFEKLEPVGRVTLRPRTVNWKNVGDNYSDALLFRRIATIEYDAPTVESVDELEWTGPRPELVELAASVDAPGLAERAVKVAEARARG
jgi:hypothetical protein